MPVLVLPVNCKIGVDGLPAGTVKIPVKIPPLSGKLPDAVPANVAVIVPAEKLPDESRTTMLPPVLPLEIVASLALAIVASVISPLTINELESNPLVLLCTTPAVVKLSMVTPDALTFIISEPLTSTETTFGV